MGKRKKERKKERKRERKKERRRVECLKKSGRITFAKMQRKNIKK